MLPIESAYKLYVDLDGKPLDSGYLYFGQPNQNPINAPVTVYWDAAGTQPALQPLRTEDGYIVRNGTPANVYYSAAYSQLVLDKKRRQVYYAPTSDDYSIVSVVLNFIASLATSAGSSLIGFIQSGAGAILRTVQDKLRERVSGEDFGMVGDGVTVNSTAAQKARESLPNGGTIELGRGTFIIDTDAALTFDVANITLRGKGGATILKAKDGAALTTLVASSAAGFVIKDLVLDGNRTNGGVAVGSFGLYLGASHARAKRVEVHSMTSYAVFCGSSVATPNDISIDTCRIHDNGGTTTTTGFGVGIYGGGTFKPNNVRIRNCTIENNYNTVPGFPGDSTATNIAGTGLSVIGCYVRNNHNIGGGQIVLTSDGVDGSTPGRFVVSGNTVVHDVIVTGENTSAIEVEGRKVTVTGNVLQSANGDGVRLETSGGDSVVGDNVIDCTGAGINLIATGGVGVRKTQVHDNQILSAGTGIQVQGNPGGVTLTDNYIDPSVPNKIVGDNNCAVIRGNYGYAPANQIGLVAGVSPYTFPLLNYDAFYVCTVANGIFSANVNGVNVSFAILIPIPVKAGQPFTVSWAGTAPTYSMCPQQ